MAEGRKRKREREKERKRERERERKRKKGSVWVRMNIGMGQPRRTGRNRRRFAGGSLSRLAFALRRGREQQCHPPSHRHCARQYQPSELFDHGEVAADMAETRPQTYDKKMQPACNHWRPFPRVPRASGEKAGLEFHADSQTDIK